MARGIKQGALNLAVIFARVSSREQENGFSIDAQVDKIRKYCISKGLNVIKEYIITESSTRGERKKFHEMLKFVEKTANKVTIVADCVDRLQRNFDQHKILSDMCKDDKIEIHFVRDMQVISKSSNSSQKLFWNMSVAMAQSYTDCSSDNIKRSIKFRRDKGEWSNIAPLGYLNAKDSDNKSILILDDVRAPLVRHLFVEYATGMHSTQSLRRVAKEIKFYSRLKKGKSIISRACIYRILNNPFYYGIMKDSEGHYISHKYDSIIDKETFIKVQKLLRNVADAEQPRLTRGYGDIPFTFTGLITCKTCGCTITPESHIKPSGKVYTYLKCSHIKGPCEQKIVNENVLLKQLDDEVFNNIKIPDKLLEALKLNIRTHYKEENKLNSSLKKRTTSEIMALEQKKERLFDFFLDGNIDKLAYEKKIAEIELQLVDLQKDAKKYAEISDDVAGTVEGMADIVANASNVMKLASPQHKRELLGLLFDNCYLDNKRLTYKLKKPFDKLISPTKGEDWFCVNADNIDDITSLTNDIAHVKSNMLSA